MDVGNVDVGQLCFVAKVALDGPFADTYFNIGRSSFSDIFDPAYAVPVTLWRDPMEFVSFTNVLDRFYSLKTHHFEHILKVSGVTRGLDKCFVLVDSVVYGTLGSWVVTKFHAFQEKSNLKWLDFIGEELWSNLREFSLGLMECLDNKCGFGGDVDSLFLTDEGLRLAKITDISSDFDNLSQDEVMGFRKVLYFCVFYPLHRGTFNDRRKFRSPEYEEVGAKLDDQRFFEDLEDTKRLKSLPYSAFLDHPALFPLYSHDRVTFYRKLALDILREGDPTVRCLNDTLFQEEIFWKETILDGSVKACLEYMEFDRVKQSNLGLTDAEIKSKVKENGRANLFGDLVRLPFNCEKHMERIAKVEGNWVEYSARDILALVDEALGGPPLNYIYSKLLNFWGVAITDALNHRDDPERQKRMHLRLWCFDFLRSRTIC